MNEYVEDPIWCEFEITNGEGYGRGPSRYLGELDVLRGVEGDGGE